MFPGSDNLGYEVGYSILFLLVRYAHIVGATFLVGGLLFYEMVLPIAISDLKGESQIAVFARARWVFRWIIWVTVVVMLCSGVGLSIRRMNSYLYAEYPQPPAGIMASPVTTLVPRGLHTGWWWSAHASGGVMAMLIALYLCSGSRPLLHPIGWLRLDLMILLIVVFFATATYQVNMIHQERAARTFGTPVIEPSIAPSTP